MKAILGGKDAQGIKNTRDINLDSKATSNSFRVVKRFFLVLLGRSNILPFFKDPKAYQAPLS